MSKDPERERSWLHTALVVVVALAIWTAALTIYFKVTHEHELKQIRDQKSQEIGELNDNFTELSSNYDALRDLFLSTGEAPVIPPTADEVADGEVVPGPAGEQGKQGDPGPAPTDEQVRTAVVAYLEENPPPSGRPPTDEEVEAAVAAFCEGRGGCVGPAGPPGPTGAPGEPGADGQPGLGATQEDIAAAVSNFCAANSGCVGPEGPAVDTFTFTYLLTTYVCSDPEGDLDYDCVPQ